MYGIPIVNKRISVTPIALVGGSVCKTADDFVEIAKTLDKAAHTGWSKLPWWILGPCFKGNDSCR